MKALSAVAGRAALFFLVLTLLCGGIYTLAVTGAAQLIFPEKANGSVIEIDGKRYGSELLGQQFTEDRHLWGRIMKIDTETFTGDDGSPLMYSWASNLSPASPEYEALVAERVERIRRTNPDATRESIPVDLVTCSGSGLDPHISPAAADYQVPRIAQATGRSDAEIRRIIEKYTTGRFLGIFGEPVVNVLKVNLALDGILVE